jgi:peptidyl-prolyl cis-trans isomerase B (cyclophilin B)
MSAVRRASRAGLAVILLVAVACESSGAGTPSTGGPCPTAAPTAAQAEEILADASVATFKTTLGEFTMDLYGDAAPIATANFVALARCGFYEGITFHRVLADFVAQAGDPNTKDASGEFEGLGTGGPGYRFAIETPPEGLNYDPYTVAMANSGMADSNGSQFFVCLSDLDASLPRTYTIFGLVTDGTDVVDAIGAVEVGNPITGVPVDPVVIESISVQPVGIPTSTGD